MHTLEIIPFHGDTISAIKTEDGKIKVSVKAVCDSIGIDHSSQIRKLKGCKWSGYSLITTPTNSGVQEIAMVDHDAIPYWIASISPRRVSTSQAAKLELYQQEVKEVLASHFLGKTKPVPEYDDPDCQVLANLLKTRIEVLEFRKQQEREQEAQWTEIKRTELIALEARADIHEVKATVYGDTDMIAIVGYCNRRGIRITEPQSSRVGMRLTNYCKANGINYGSARDGLGAHNERHDGVNTYPREVLDKWRNGEIKVNNLEIEDDIITDHAPARPQMSYGYRNWR